MSVNKMNPVRLYRGGGVGIPHYKIFGGTGI